MPRTTPSRPSGRGMRTGAPPRRAGPLAIRTPGGLRRGGRTVLGAGWVTTRAARRREGRPDARLTADHLVDHLLTPVLAIPIAATLIRSVPRLPPVDPAGIALGRMASGEGAIEGGHETLDVVRARMGIDRPLVLQDLEHVGGAPTRDLGLSTTSFPTPVGRLIAAPPPWAPGLTILTLVVTFLVGDLRGASTSWDRTPKPARVPIAVAMMFASIPPASRASSRCSSPRASSIGSRSRGPTA